MRRTRRMGAVVAAAVLLAGVAACGGDDDGAGEGRELVDRTTTTTVDIEDVTEEDRDDVIIETALREVEAWWTEVYPEVYGSDFEPVSGGFFPYGPERDAVPCGDPVLTYDEVAGNAFYCPSSDLIAWDTDGLTNDLLAEYGEYSLMIVMAHEYGHAVQARVPVVGPTIATEQQADCFAGAFTSFVEEGGSDEIDVDLDDLDNAVAGFISLRDSIGTPSEDPSAHGSAFDRVGAFQDGYENGPARCAEYEEIYDNGGTTVIDIPFIDEADFVSGGNAPFDPTTGGNIFELSLTSLEGFWAAVMPQFFGVEFDGYAPDQIAAYDVEDPSSLPSCQGEEPDPEALEDQAFFCFGAPDDPSDDFVGFDMGLMAGLYDEIGDFAIATTISKQYSFGVQVQIGNLEDDLPSNLQADCFTGAWAGQLALDTLQGTGDVALSPGDLDEAIISFLKLAEDGDPEIRGTPFERVTALREGFFNGIDTCAGYVAG